MSDPIGPLLSRVAPLVPGDGAGRPVPVLPEGSGSFGETLVRAINEVSATQEHSQALTGAFLRGEPVELHQVMAAAEEAGIALELLIELRNKLADAYRTVIAMQ